MQKAVTLEKPLSTTDAPARDVRYDLLRIVAACMVVFLHVSGMKWSAVPHNSFDWAVLNVYDSLVRSAVPLFFMLSGAFLLKKEIDLKKLWLKKILPLTGIYIAWSILYAIDAIGLTVFFSTSPSALLSTVVSSHYHLWFLPVLIGLYILQPVLYAVTHYDGGKFTPYILACFAVFTVIPETLLPLLGGHPTAAAILTRIPVELTESAGYILLGYYLAHQKPICLKRRLTIPLFFGTVVVSAAITQLHAHLIGAASDVLYGNFALPVCAEAILLFLCFQNTEPKRLTIPKASAAVGTLSSLTFGIYLLHPFILDKLETHLSLHPMSFAPIVSIPVIAVIAILVSGAITFVMLKIPVVNRLWKL